MFELVLSGPGLNALGTRLMETILAKLDEAGGAPVLLTGEGPAFSAGLDLKEVAALDLPAAETFLRVLERMVDTLYRYPGPTVAFVNGHAIAGGCVLALACDARVSNSASAARMGLNEVALGLQFPPSILDLVRRRVPPQHLETVVLGAALHLPDEAKQLGLLDVVVEDAHAHARAMVRKLGAHPPAAYAAAKRALRPALAGRPDEVRAFLDEGLASWVSPELKATIARMFDRR
jgi:enoyl-CoA hydratase